MIRTNLATRPFYNTQAVTLLVGVLAALVALATLFNVVSVIRYSQSDSALATQATQDAERAAMLRAEAAKLRGSVDARQVDLIAGEARLANDLIDRRVFSWTELFNTFERTLPTGVRITAVRPAVDDNGRILLSVAVTAKGVDDVNAFMENLEKTTAFQRLLTREERVDDGGELEATIEAFYQQTHAPDAAAPGAPAQGSPAAATPAPASGAGAGAAANGAGPARAEVPAAPAAPQTPTPASGAGTKGGR